MKLLQTVGRPRGYQRDGVVFGSAGEIHFATSRVLPVTWGNFIRRLPESVLGFFWLEDFAGGLLSAQELQRNARL